MSCLIINTVDKLLSGLTIKKRNFTDTEMGEKQDIKTSQHITLYVSMLTIKSNLLKESRVSTVIHHKTPNDLVSFGGMVLFCS